jgi:MscS family membrane protein
MRLQTMIGRWAGWVVVLTMLLGHAAMPALAQDQANEPQYTVDNPRWNSLASPRATMFTFLEAANHVLLGRDDALPRIRTTLAGGDQYDKQQLTRIVDELKGVLDRLGEVKTDQLPDVERVRKDKITRWEYFPGRGEHFQWVWDELDHGPAGKIVLAADADGDWRFTEATVEDIGTLAMSTRDLKKKYIPTDQEISDVLSVVGPTFGKTAWWGWVWLLAAIFVGLAAGKITQWLLRTAADRIDNRQWTLRAATFRSLASPASLALLSVGLMVGLWSVYMEKDIRAFSNKLVSFLFIVSIAWFMYNLVEVIDIFLRRLTEKTETHLDDMIVPLIRKTLRIFLVIIFILVVAQNVFGLNITSWLAGLGIAGLAVSLAAQDSVKNLFGSITVFFDKPFLVNDFIVFDGFTGTVEEIGFRSTRLRMLSGHLVTIPNMKFIDGNVENISKRPYIRRQMDVTITYDTEPDMIEKAVNILRDVLNDPEVVEPGKFNMEDNPPRIAFNELNSDSLNIRAYYWYQMAGDKDRGFFTFMEHAQIVNMKLFRAYGETGIDFAFPTQTLYLAGDPSRELKVTVHGDSA